MTTTDTTTYDFVATKGGNGSPAGWSTVQGVVTPAGAWTLSACRALYDHLRQADPGMTAIQLNRSIWRGGDGEDVPAERVSDERAEYTARTNSLLIWRNGEPVYANDNGHVCRDQVALYDSMAQ